MTVLYWICSRLSSSFGGEISIQSKGSSITVCLLIWQVICNHKRAPACYAYGREFQVNLLLELLFCMPSYHRWCNFLCILQKELFTINSCRAGGYNCLESSIWCLVHCWTLAKMLNVFFDISLSVWWSLDGFFILLMLSVLV